MSTQRIRTNPRTGGGAGYEVWSPYDVGPRLMPSLKLDDGSRIYIAFLGYEHQDGEQRPQYSWTVDDGDGKELGTGEDLYGAVAAIPDVEAVFHTFASFVHAWVEARGDSENGALFPESMRDWAEANYEELWLRLSSTVQ